MRSVQRYDAQTGSYEDVDLGENYDVSYDGTRGYCLNVVRSVAYEVEYSPAGSVQGVGAGGAQAGLHYVSQKNYFHVLLTFFSFVLLRFLTF